MNIHKKTVVSELIAKIPIIHVQPSSGRRMTVALRAKLTREMLWIPMYARKGIQSTLKG